MENLKVVFANQKGGVGKTTLCTLFANYLANKKENVLVVDADLQKSIYTQRQSDAQVYEDEPPYEVQAILLDSFENVHKIMDFASQLPGYGLFVASVSICDGSVVSLFS